MANSCTAKRRVPVETRAVFLGFAASIREILASVPCLCGGNFNQCGLSLGRLGVRGGQELKALLLRASPWDVIF